jgi:hypothetical protein
MRAPLCRARASGGVRPSLRVAFPRRGQAAQPRRETNSSRPVGWRWVAVSTRSDVVGQQQVVTDLRRQDLEKKYSHGEP